MEIRYHLDENVNGAVARGLARRGISVSTTTECNLLGAPDQTQLEFAASRGRVLVTHDEDHLILASQGIQHAGIAYRHAEQCTVGDLVHGLSELWRTQAAEEMVNRVVFLAARRH